MNSAIGLLNEPPDLPGLEDMQETLKKTDRLPSVTPGTIPVPPPAPPAPPPPPAPPAPPGLPKEPVARERTVLELVRAQRITIRKLKFAPPKREKSDEEKSKAELLDVTPTEQLTINRRLKLQKEYYDSSGKQFEYKKLVHGLNNLDFSTVSDSEELGKLLLQVVEEFVRPLNLLPGELHRMVFHVEKDDWEKGAPEESLWPLERSSVAEAYHSILNRFNSVVQDIQAMLAHTAQNAKDGWDALDSRYLALDKRVKQLLEESSTKPADRDKRLLIVVETTSRSAGKLNLAERGSFSETDMQSKAAALGENITLFELDVEARNLPLSDALLQLGVPSDVAQDFVKRREAAAEQLQKRFETAYFLKAGNVLADMWNEYYSAVKRDASKTFIENKFVNILNAAFLFGGKRLGTDRRLEKYYESLGIGKYISGILKKVLNELGTPEAPGPRAEMSLDRVTVDTEMPVVDIDYCDNCGVGLHDSPDCTGCGLAYYCSVECQQEHWDVHKERCKFFRE